VDTVGKALSRAARSLADRHASARLDAEVLLAHALGQNRVYLYGHSDEPLGTAAAARFSALVVRRARGEPVAYLVGRREFWSLDLEVSNSTLIPRPETETLVAAALSRIPVDAECRVADLGTGSGAVALAIVRERPRALVVASDRSERALRVAAANARRLAGGRLWLVRGYWCEPFGEGSLHVIVANPPYVARNDAHLAQGDVAFEPREALAAGPDGLAALRVIARTAPARLRPGGWLLLEHGADQGPALREMFCRFGYRDVRTLDDMEGRQRVTEGRRP
jgi:release factor glutamine methyltransferase